ncbi:MAG: sugar phosphate isomerase/epimerase family protein [Clostridia bacterium]
MKPKQMAIGYSFLVRPDDIPVSVDTCRAIAASGVHCLELAITDWPDDRHDPMTALLTQSAQNVRAGGLQVWSCHIPFGTTWDISDPLVASDAVRRMRAVLDVCEALGIPIAVVHASYEPIREARAQRLAQCAQSLRALARPGIRLAVETLPRTCLGNRSEELLSLLSDIPYVDACVDVNHSHQEYAVKTLRTLKDRLLTLHISDDDGLDEKHWYPGEGVREWAYILHTLEEIDYTGAFMYEVGVRPDGHPEYITQNFQKLLQLYAERFERP